MPPGTLGRITFCAGTAWFIGNEESVDGTRVVILIQLKGPIDERLDSGLPQKDALETVLKHKDGSSDTFQVNHTMSQEQIEWFKAGSALNYVAKSQKK